MKIIILQLMPMDPKFMTIKCGIMFDPDKQAVIRANFSHYHVVYQDDLEIPADRELKDYVFETFNLNHPAHYTGMSMSSGDILLWEETPNQYRGALCCMIGWDEISAEDVQTMIDQITGLTKLEDF